MQAGLFCRGDINGGTNGQLTKQEIITQTDINMIIINTTYVKNGKIVLTWAGRYAKVKKQCGAISRCIPVKMGAVWMDYDNAKQTAALSTYYIWGLLSIRLISGETPARSDVTSSVQC